MIMRCFSDMQGRGGGGDDIVKGLVTKIFSGVISKKIHLRGFQIFLY